jgi:hypothetical protein
MTINLCCGCFSYHLQAAAAADSLPFRRLLARDHSSDRETEDRSAALTNPLLLSAYKRFEVRRCFESILWGVKLAT